MEQASTTPTKESGSASAAASGGFTAIAVRWLRELGASRSRAKRLAKKMREKALREGLRNPPGSKFYRRIFKLRHGHRGTYAQAKADYDRRVR